MVERGIDAYFTYGKLIETGANSSTEINDSDDIYIPIKAFMETSTVINGEILGQNNALKLNPTVMGTQFFKHQFFTSPLIINNLADDVLYIEFIIVSYTSNKPEKKMNLTTV